MSNEIKLSLRCYGFLSGSAQEVYYKMQVTCSMQMCTCKASVDTGNRSRSTETGGSLQKFPSHQYSNTHQRHSRQTTYGTARSNMTIDACVKKRSLHEKTTHKMLPYTFTIHRHTGTFHRFDKTSIYKNTSAQPSLCAEKGISIKKYML